DTTNTNIRCNYLEKNSWADVETLVIKAGETVGFGIGKDCAYSDTTIYHAGPGHGYLSRAPNDDLATYKGDGNWFKIKQYGVRDAKNWELNSDTHFMNFTIPKTTPPGKYLLRGEQMFGLHPGYNKTQFYHSCAHIEVVGPGGG
ncbi:uncharacterized protein BDR25DRAFT_197593, partial [Lindgomyces ingoldianus]